MSDVAHRAGDDKDRQAADDFLGLMTPVIKGFLTDKGFSGAVEAQQMFGGHGYIAEWGMEQFVRDARIAMIYEGANGIQALDLVGRKLPANNGRAIQAFFKELAGFVAERKADPALGPLVAPLEKAVGDLQKATMWFLANAMKNPDNAGAGSTDYMHLMGHVVLAGCGCAWPRPPSGSSPPAIRAGRCWSARRSPRGCSWSACCPRPAPASPASPRAPRRSWPCRRRRSEGWW